MQNLQAAIISFHGQNLIVITRDDQRLVAMRPVCEGVGLDWKAQYNRIKRDEVLSTCVVMMTIQLPGDTQQRQVVCLPLDYLNGWLFGIDVNRCREEIRPALIRYKRECYAVLAAHFQKKSTNAEPSIAGRQYLIGTTKLTALKGVIADKAKQLPKEKQLSFKQAMHHRLHTRFNVPRTELIPHESFADACNFIAAYALEGEWLPREDANPGRLDIHYPVDKLLFGRRRGMIEPRTADTQFLNVTLNDLREFHSSPCEKILGTLAEVGYEVEGAWWELRTYRNKLAYLMPLIESLSAVAAEPQQYVIPAQANK